MSWRKFLFFIVLASGLSWGAQSGAAILVVAPHPDDDVIVAAGIISAAVNRGEKVTVVYMTNGDAVDGIVSGTTRQNEAATAQITELGLIETDLIFLGYPDAYLRDLSLNYPLLTDQLTTSNGISQTYASRGIGGVDYHTYQFGSPAAYNRANVLQDLESIFTNYKPDHIYTLAEFDTHIDHSATYDFVQTALNTVVAADPTYKPVIHKSIVHTGFPSAWPAALDPTTPFTEPPNSSSLPVLWGNRETVDVPVAMQSTNLNNNLKYRAIASHASQGGAGGFLGQFIHKDEIFWTTSINTNGNQPPQADAGQSVTIKEGSTVLLDGTGSSDPDGDTLSYAWTQTGGTALVLSDGTGVSPRFLAPSGLVRPETLTFELMVSDGSLNSAVDVASVLVDTLASNITNQVTTVTASSAAAGQPASAAVDGVIDGWPSNALAEWSSNGEGVGAWLNLGWSGSYSIDRVVLYDRPNLVDQATSLELRFSDGTVVSVGALDNAGGPTAVTFAPVVASSMQVVVTSVLGGTVNVGLAEVEVYGLYSGANRAPLANAGADQTVNEGTTILLDGTGSSDPDGDTLSYAWTQTGGTAVVLSDVTAASPTFVAPSGLAGPEVLSFSLVVSDGALSSVADTVSINVLVPPKLPNDVVHYYRLDEISGLSFKDETGTAAATCTNCPTAVSGFVGGAQQFDGINNEVVVAANAGLNWSATQSFTVEFWMKNNSCTGQQAVTGRDDASNSLHWWVGCENGNAAFYLVDKGGVGIGSELFGTSNVADGNWHHVVAIRDAYTNTNQLIVDGIEEARVSISYSTGFDSTSAELNIGWLNNGVGDYHFGGLIDEVAIFNRVLPLAVISRHYNDGRIGLKRGYWSCGADINIMPLGDSITGGDGSVSSGGYRGPLLSSITASGYGVNFVGRRTDAISNHEGWGGYSPSGIAAITPDAMIAGAPNLILLHAGTNVESGFPDTVYLESILDAIVAYDPNITVVLARIINRATYYSLATDFNNNIQVMADARIAAGDRIVVVDMEQALDYANDMYDLLHPNYSGYTKMASVWERGLRSFIPFCQQVAPMITSKPVTASDNTGAYVYDVEATGFPYANYTLISAPAGMTIHPDTGRINWKPSVAGNYNVTVQASNSWGTDTQSFTVTARLAGYANISALATITASTEDVTAAQGAIKAVDGVVDGYPGDASREWATLGEGAGAWIQLDWAVPYAVDRVVLYDRPNTVDHITGATLIFSDGSTLSMGALDNSGAATEINFAAKTITSIRMSVDSVSLDNVNTGLAEIEVFGSQQ